MEKCPHCQFLVREESHTCDVCHKPLREASGVPSFAGDARAGSFAATHVGPSESGFPVSILFLFVVGLLFAAAVWLSTIYWL